jgi:hypothetical protein
MRIQNLVALAIRTLTKRPQAHAGHTSGPVPGVPAEYLVFQAVWEAAHMQTFNSGESRRAL